jgi:hypothetical protein
MHEDNINTLFDKTAPTSFKQWQKKPPRRQAFHFPMETILGGYLIEPTFSVSVPVLEQR